MLREDGGMISISLYGPSWGSHRPSELAFNWRTNMAWEIHAASDGTNFDVYRQDKNNSCACACIAMAAKLMKNKTLDEATVRGWISNAEGGGRKSKEGVREFDRTGTFNDTISSGFTQFGV